MGLTVVHLFFLFLVQNIDCGYSFEPSRRACPCNIHRIISEASIENFNKKNRYTTANPCFFFLCKVKFKGLHFTDMFSS